MPHVGQFKAIAILLLGLCTFASFFYFKVWSSIDADNDNGVPIHSADAKAGLSDSIIFRQQHHHQHQHQSKQSSAKQESHRLQQDQANLADSGFDRTGRPFLLPETELRPMMKEPAKEEDNKVDFNKPVDTSTPSPPQTPPCKNRKQRGRERLKQENAERKQLNSTNNTRIAALNLKAFARFCHSRVAQDRIAAAGQKSLPASPLSAVAAAVGSDTEFATYEDWIDYIQNNNTEPERQEEDASAATENPPKRQQRLPLFMERPLRGWIINHTAILESCDRILRTSAHCLDYLTKEHLYLTPSREARSWPNRILRYPSQPATSEMDAIVVDSESTAKGAVVDGYQRETGSGSDDRVVTATSTTTTTATIARANEEAEMMDFHMFW
ncbi:hypothetical protein BGW39_003901 [Mortierella sp. 14UC]|nr:hypothetical protein BGW39_003901 [Mortierella sp. 14UC]